MVLTQFICQNTKFLKIFVVFYFNHLSKTYFESRYVITMTKYLVLNDYYLLSSCDQLQ